MAAEETRIKAGLKNAEDELNLIKNQVQQTLLDIREHILDVTNPFNAVDDALTDEDEIEFDDFMGGGAGAPGAPGAPGATGTDGASGAETVDGQGDTEEELEGEDTDEEIVEELSDDAQDDPGEEFIEEIPDDGYMDDQIIDDGGGAQVASQPVADPDEYFEEEEMPEEVEEVFEPDQAPTDSEQDPELEGAGTAQDGTDTAGGVEGTEPGADGDLAPLIANFDVLTMAGLVRWVAVTTERIGTNRTEIMLDAFEASGRIATSTRVVLHHLMALTEEDPARPVPVRDIVSAMVRMEGVLSASNSSDSTRLLSMLMDADNDPLDLIA